MSAKSKKRLCKLENRLENFEKLELKDVVCSICQSIVIEPVTLPCSHFFCQRCFNCSIENNALCCPLCRLRIGSWLRKATKQNNLVNVELWHYIKTKFSSEIDTKLKGDDIDLPEEKPFLRLSAPGEIRSEYEAELKKLRAEHLQLEQKHINETTLLIEKIQQEEQEAQQRYLERLKQDELLAKQIQEQEESPAAQNKERKQSLRNSITKTKLKPTKLDGYLTKKQTSLVVTHNTPLLTDDNTSTDGSTPRAATARAISRPSPEVVPSYGKLIKTFIDKKMKINSNFWNKENGEIEKKEDPQPTVREINCTVSDTKEKKGVIKSLPVSLPLPSCGVLQHKTNVPENRNFETGSADSMCQELCFFKPIEKTSTTSFKTTKVLPLRVPCVRAEPEMIPHPREVAPSRDQYIEELCRLRQLSLAKSLPSAFVIALSILRVTKESSVEIDSNRNQAVKRNAPSNNVTLSKKVAQIKKPIKVPNNTTANLENNLRRTRSMGSISKDENETTPKKAKILEHKANSERKPHLRSDSKRLSARKRLESPLLAAKPINNHKVNLAVKNLSSPLKNCDVKKILQEQLRIEKMIEQEQKDLELARQMDAEWNGRRQLRRAPGKRQVTLNYALRPAKKVKA